MYHFNIFHETNKTQFDECRETVTRYENIPPGMLATVIDRIIKDPAFHETTDWVQVTVFTEHSEPQQTGYDGKQSRQAQASIVSEPYELYGSEAFQREFYARTGVPFAQRWREVGAQMEKLHGQTQASEPTGDYQIRDHVSYAVGDPYSIFDYIPHVVMPNGGILMSQDAIEEAWRRSHDFEPLEGWRASRYSESEGGE